MEKQAKPRGILILGGLNCFLFGLLFLFMSVSAYLKTTPQDLDKITALLKEKSILVQITYQQFKYAIIVYGCLSFIFFISGLGILFKKEWARKLTVYFAFSIIAMTFFSIIATPTLIQQAILQIIYPAILIVYFTNKRIGEYFTR
jgi:hypothetical protein